MVITKVISYSISLYFSLIYKIQWEGEKGQRNRDSIDNTKDNSRIDRDMIYMEGAKDMIPVAIKFLSIFYSILQGKENVCMFLCLYLQC